MSAVLLLAAAAAVADPPPPRAEFESIAQALRASQNPYVGDGRRLWLEEQVRALASRPDVALPERLQVRAALGLERLRQGDVDGAAAAVAGAFADAESAGSGPEGFPFLYRARALVNLRRGEVQNCIARHNAECCIFPLAGGGVHTAADPVVAAAADYEAYLRHFPADLGVRWLLNLAHMAAGDYPEGVPEALRIPPAAFESAAPAPRFTDVAPALGVDVLNLCGGAVVDDLDGDGRLDVATSTFDVEGPLRVFVRRADGTFADRSEASGAIDQLGGLNCIAGDYDDDGDLDLLVLRGAWLFDDGRIRNSLLRNDGDATFTDVTRAAGLAEPAMPTQAACFGDFDLDGDLDLYVGNEARPGDPSGGRYPSQLFRNDGDGTFTDVAASAGTTNDRYAKGVTCGDYDGDGDLDLYVSNIGPNRLYRNDGDGTFTDVAAEAGVLGPDRSFASWFFDYDDDGRLDLFVAAYEAPIAAVCADHLGLPFRAARPALYRNRGDGTFEDVALRAGLDHAYLPMGASFGDVDGDGRLDVYLATGDPDFESLMPNVLLRNLDGRRFADATTAAGLGHLQKGHGVAFADLDRDGDLDLYHQLGGFLRGDAFHNALFVNGGMTTGATVDGAADARAAAPRWVTLRLRGDATNHFGLGCRIAVTVRRPDGSTRTLHRAHGSVSSFGGSPLGETTIGLGDATAIESVSVDWPVSKVTRTYADVPMNGAVDLREDGTAERVEWGPLPLPAK